MLTARGEVTDRIVGLEIGADDYLPKPFEPRELLARIQSILRRSKSALQKKRHKFADLEIDYKQHAVWLGGEPIALTSSEFAILEFFTRNVQTVITRDNIYEKIKGIDDDSFERSIDVMISRLRNKLHDDPKKPRFIKTIWGSGYKFIGE